MESRNFTGQTLLITGAGSGLGQHLALDFSALGAQVILAGRDKEKLQFTAGEIEKCHGVAHIISVDVQDESSVRAMMKALTDISPKLDLAINAAGVVRAGNIEDTSSEDFILMMRTNFYGVWLCMKEQLSLMKKQSHGTIINISANIGTHTIRPGLGGYGATKAALTVLTKTAALEALPFHVRVHSISPGPLDTHLSYRKGEDKAARDERIHTTNPSGRVGTLAEVSKTIQWLCTSPEYLVGQDIIIDGGASL